MLREHDREGARRGYQQKPFWLLHRVPPPWVCVAVLDGTKRRFWMWIETATEGEYLNPDMIERVTVEDSTLMAHMPSGASVVISKHWTTEEGFDSLTTLMRMVGNPLE
jgi:hypothetical protein